MVQPGEEEEVDAVATSMATDEQAVPEVQTEAEQQAAWLAAWKTIFVTLPLTVENLEEAAHGISRKLCKKFAKQCMDALTNDEKTAVLMTNSFSCCDAARDAPDHPAECKYWCVGKCTEYTAEEYLLAMARDGTGKHLEKALRRYMKCNERAHPVAFEIDQAAEVAMKALKYMESPLEYYEKYISPMVQRRLQHWTRGQWLPSNAVIKGAPCFCPEMGKVDECPCRAGADKADDDEAIEQIWWYL